MGAPQTFPKLIEDEWLSKQIGKRAFRAEGELADEEIDRLPKGSFAYAKVNSENIALVRRYSKLGFYVADCAVQLRQEQTLPAQESKTFQVRKATAGDEESVTEIAGQAFRYSRFHLDPGFTREVADRVKREWVRNFFRGQRGDALWVATIEGKVAGFSLMLKRELWLIDLIAVSPNNQGQGVGSSLILALNREYGPLDAGTQAANTASLRLYQNAGFFVQSTNFVLHRHG